MAWHAGQRATLLRATAMGHPAYPSARVGRRCYEAICSEQAGSSISTCGSPKKQGWKVHTLRMGDQPRVVLNRRGQRIPVLLPDLSSLDPSGPGARLLGRGEARRWLVRRLRRRAEPLVVAGPGFRPRSPALLAVSSHAFLDLIGVDPGSTTTNVVLLVVLPRHPEGG